MKVKTKIALSYLKIANTNRRARKVGKKTRLDENNDKYSVIWKNNWVLKKTKKMAKKIKLNLSVEGYNDLPKPPYILAPNHSSSFDPALILMALENPGLTSDSINVSPIFIAKDEVKSNKKVFGYAEILNTHYLPRSNARGALKILDNWATQAKNEKRAAVIFPEGTRSKDGNINSFKGGAFKMAKKAYLPIVPVTINNALSITDTSRRKKLNIEIIFHKAIKASSVVTHDTKDIAKNVEKIVKSKWKKPDGKRSKLEGKLA